MIHTVVELISDVCVINSQICVRSNNRYKNIKSCLLSTFCPYIFAPMIHFRTVDTWSRTNNQ